MAVELAALEQAILTLPAAPALVAIDTFSKYTAGLDEDSNTEVAAFLSALSRGVREQFKSSVLLVAHSGHANETRPRGATR